MNSMTLCDRAGITYRQLDHWLHRGYIKCVGDSPNTGSGNVRQFEPLEARVALFMGDLVRSGMRPEHAVTLAREIAATGMAKRGQFVIVAAQAGIPA